MTGGGEPATLWRTFMSNALADTPASDFDKPDGFKMPAPKYEAPKKSSSSSSSKKAADTKKSSKSKSKADALPGDGNVPQPPRSSGKSSTPPPVRPPKQ